MGLDIMVGDFCERIGTYSEVYYFMEWLSLAGLPVIDMEDLHLQPDQAQQLLQDWLPEVKKALEITRVEWADEAYEAEQTPDGWVEIPSRTYPLWVWVGEEGGIITPIAFRAGTTPEQFIRRLTHIIRTLERAFNQSVRLSLVVKCF